MSTGGQRGVVARTFGRGYFPHQLAWLIDNPVRRFLITPEQFADRLSLGTASRVLEIGPGSGYFSVELARRVPDGRLELLDLQSEMLAKARRKLEAAGFRDTGFAAADAGVEIPYAASHFDVVAMVAVLGEVPNRDGCLREVIRVLRPGGALVVHEHIPDPDRIALPELRTLAERAGFRFTRHIGPAWNFTAIFERP